jgi:hypothetical protein
MNTQIEKIGGGSRVKIPSAEIKDTPFASVKFQFVLVTPELAADWLKHNLRNRKLKEAMLEGYIMDMRNGAWLTTHEGIAFDEENNLTDGQHRLEGIVRAKRPVLMVVSTGWPLVQGKKKTMDVVNMGASRSLADQLHLQHDVEKRDAGTVVRICNSIAAACFDLTKVRKSTTDTILGVFALYKAEISWLLANPVNIRGLGQSTVLACMAMHHALFQKQTEEAFRRLMTGADLSAGNALLPLRNWLMSANSENATIRMATLHHLYAFKQNQTVPQICTNSNKAYVHVLELSVKRIEKICAIYGQPLPEFLSGEKAKLPPAAGPFSEDAVRVGLELKGAFSSTDVIARTEANAGQWLMAWLNRGWIAGVGGNQFVRTDKFGKPA